LFFVLEFYARNYTQGQNRAASDFAVKNRCVSLNVMNFLNWHDFEGSRTEKFFKTTLWQSDNVMVGLNCLEPGQSQALHAHEGADKFYFVLAGRGNFTVGEEVSEAGEGTLIVAPAGVPHGVTNHGNDRLSLLIGISPPVK